MKKATKREALNAIELIGKCWDCGDSAESILAYLTTDSIVIAMVKK